MLFLRLQSGGGTLAGIAQNTYLKKKDKYVRTRFHYNYKLKNLKR
jgi:hypothetical protein